MPSTKKQNVGMFICKVCGKSFNPDTWKTKHMENHHAQEHDAMIQAALNFTSRSHPSIGINSK
jgi:transcription elongation factor Elf1